MAKWTFNPFTGTLDKMGEGGSGPGSITISGDTGSPISGSSFSFLGQDANGIDIIDVDTSTGNILISNNSWETQYIVDKSTTPGLRGTFTSIQAALDQAKADGMNFSNPKMIYIRNGTYLEDLTIYDGAHLVSQGFGVEDSSLPPYAQINGNVILEDICIITVCGISFACVSGDLITTGSTVNSITLDKCVFKHIGLSGSILKSSSSGLMLNFKDCFFSYTASTLNQCFDVSTVSGSFYDCNFSKCGFIKNGGFLEFYDCLNIGEINQLDSSSNGVRGYNSSFATNNSYNVHGDGGASFINCSFVSDFGSASVATNLTGEIKFTNCHLDSNLSIPSSFYNESTSIISYDISQVGNVLLANRKSTTPVADIGSGYIGIKGNSTSVSVVLEKKFQDYQTYVVDEEGTASSNPITITSVGGSLINGSSSYIIDENFGSALFHWNGEEWVVISQGSFSGGGSSGVTFGTNSGSVGPTSNISIFGAPKGSSNVMSTSVISGSVYVEDRTWISEFIVDPSSTIGSRGTYTTISAAISAAVSAGASNSNFKTIILRPGVYAGDYSVPAGIRIVGVSDSDLNFKLTEPGQQPAVIIRGRITLTGTSNFSLSFFENIHFDSASDIPLVVGQNCRTYFINCSFEPYINNICFDFSNNLYSKSLTLLNCSFKENSEPRHLFLLYETELIAENCLFLEGLGGILHENNSILRLNNIKNIAEIASDGGRLNLSNCNFSPTPVGSYNLSGIAEGILKDCHFSGLDEGCIESTMMITPINCSVKGVSSTINGKLFEQGFTYKSPTVTQGNIMQGESVILPYTVPNNVYFVGVLNSSSPGALTFDVVSGIDPYTVGQTFYIKDLNGTATTFPIEITGTVDFPCTFDGDSTIYMDTDYECIKLRYSGNGSFSII